MSEEPFVLRHGAALLRDLIPEDVERHVRWLTIDTEWLEWDAPWEPRATLDAETVRARFLARLHRPSRDPRTTLELCDADGVHVGRVNTYRIAEDPARRAVGIGVRDEAHRGRGIGGDAFVLWTAYVFRAWGCDRVFCETWSGNGRMLRLAARSGFREAERRPGARRVRGDRHDAIRLVAEREEFLRSFLNLPAGPVRG